MHNYLLGPPNPLGPPQVVMPRYGVVAVVQGGVTWGHMMSSVGPGEIYYMTHSPCVSTLELIYCMCVCVVQMGVRRL